MPLTPYWQSPLVALYQGDAATVLGQLPAESVDLCVTSPPFWGLRDYKVPGQIGLEPTPEAWLEHILAVFREVRRVLRPWAVAFVEIGESYWGGKGQSGYELPDEAEERHKKGVTLQRSHNVPGDMAMRPSDGKHPIIKPLDLVGIPFRLALALQKDKWWLRSVIIWDKPSPMPESVAGWRWQRCRVKVNGHSQKSGGLTSGKSGFPSMDTIPLAQWADCPGCPKCSPNDGLVLRKGSWRPTEAHSYILMLAKGVPYFANGEAVRERWTDQRPHDLERALTGSPSYNGKSQLPDAQGAVPNIRPVGNPLMGRNLRSVWHIGPEPNSMAVCGACGKVYDSAPKHGCPCKVYVGADEATDGMIRIVSPLCPVHAPGPIPNDLHDEPQGALPPRIGDSESYPVQEPLDEPLAILSLFSEVVETVSDGTQDVDAATSHSRPLSKTGHESETTPSYSSSEETLCGIADIEDSHACEEQHPGRAGNSIGGDSGEYGQGLLSEKFPRNRDTENQDTPSGNAHCNRQQNTEGSRTLPAQDGLSEKTPDGTENKPSCLCSYKLGLTSHYSTFPTGLPEKCILAGTSEWGNCPRCGMPWAPMIESESQFTRPGLINKYGDTGFTLRNDDDRLLFRPVTGFKILGWRPTCACGLAEREAPVVLDPFVGTGTTCVAAQQLGRKSIGIDLNPKYLDMAAKRLEGISLHFPIKGVSLPLSTLKDGQEGM